MDDQQQRLAHESAYLMSKVIEKDSQLAEVIIKLNATIEGLQALERVELLTAEQLGEKFKVPKTRIYELVRSRQLPCIRFGENQMRFDPIAVRKWLDEFGQVINEQDQSNNEPDAESGLKLVAR